MATRAMANERATEVLLEHVDQRILWSARSWEEYQALDAMRGDDSKPRLTYLDGELELMSPSDGHEGIEWLLGRLLEIYMGALGVNHGGVGHWTLKVGKQAGLEPDGCWVIGGRKRRDRPDLALEVQWTRGGIKKLEIYRRLKVPEVWIWRASEIHIHVLTRTGYKRRERSALLPGLDLALLLRWLSKPAEWDTLEAFRAELARRLPPA